MTETYTYPDGSQRVGCPPFPKLSPIQEAQGMKEPEPEPQEVKRTGRKKKEE